MASDAPLESLTESNFVDHVAATGCLCIKLNPLGRVGLPDRLCLGPHGFIMFVELKRLGKVPTPRQARFHRILRKFGFIVVVPDNINDAVYNFNYLLREHMKGVKNGKAN